MARRGGISSGEPVRHAEVWSHTFGERKPDFVLTIDGETIGRVKRGVLPDAPAWSWSIVCLAFPSDVLHKTMPPLGGEVATKRAAVEALRSAWAIEREWRRQFRDLTARTLGCWPAGYLEAAWRGFDMAPETTKGAPAEAEAPRAGTGEGG